MPQMGISAGVVQYPHIQQQQHIAHVQPQIVQPIKPEIQPYYEGGNFFICCELINKKFFFQLK